MKYSYVSKNNILSKVFVHRANIPKKFSIAVYNVMSNNATADDWEIIDGFVEKGEEVLDWVKSILISNEVEELDEEMEWWKKEIFGTLH